MEIEQKVVFSREQLEAYFASYVGMEGGNPAAPIWFCDSAPHPGSESLAVPLYPRTQPTAWDDKFRDCHRDSMARWQSHHRIARIMAAARAQTFDGRQNGDDWKRYFDKHLYGPQGAEFKVSLFPLPAYLVGLTSWSKAFREQPALRPKQRYLDLCRTGSRFRFIEEMRRQRKPRVVVCLGERHTADFVRAFALEAVQSEDYILQPADLAKTLQVMVHDDTTWIICPALAGPSGLTSDTLLDAMGKYLARWLQPADFPPPR